MIWNGWRELPRVPAGPVLDRMVGARAPLPCVGALAWDGIFASLRRLDPSVGQALQPNGWSKYGCGSGSREPNRVPEIERAHSSPCCATARSTRELSKRHAWRAETS